MIIIYLTRVSGEDVPRHDVPRSLAARVSTTDSESLTSGCTASTAGLSWSNWCCPSAAPVGSGVSVPGKGLKITNKLQTAIIYVLFAKH